MIEVLSASRLLLEHRRPEEPPAERIDQGQSEWHLYGSGAPSETREWIDACIAALRLGLRFPSWQALLCLYAPITPPTREWSGPGLRHICRRTTADARQMNCIASVRLESVE